MGTLRILNGHFRSGRASFDNLSIELRGLSGPESVPLSEIADIRLSGRERRVDTVGTLKQAAAGSIIGGIAAGAVAGGLTGPVGALLGAAAGAVVTGRQLYPIATVYLLDGRHFIAVAKETEWVVLRSAIVHAPKPKQPKLIQADHASSPQDARGLLKGVRARLPKLPFK